MSRPTYAISREIGAIAVFIGRLLQGLFISLGRKARTEAERSVSVSLNTTNNIVMTDKKPRKRSALRILNIS